MGCYGAWTIEDGEDGTELSLQAFLVVAATEVHHRNLRTVMQSLMTGIRYRYLQLVIQLLVIGVPSRHRRMT